MLSGGKYPCWSSIEVKGVGKKEEVGKMKKKKKKKKQKKKKQKKQKK